jgi:patatin-like phospholipase/acyl hydrolase
MRLFQWLCILTIVLSLSLFASLQASNPLKQEIDPQGDSPSFSLPNTINIVTIDGGGMRGIIALEIVKALNEQMSSGSMHHHALWFGGSSAGAFLASGLAKDLTYDFGVKFFLDEGPKIFQQSWGDKLGSLWKPAYLDTNLNKALQNVMSAETKLRDLKKGLMITAYEIAQGSGHGPGLFTFNSQNPDHGTIPLWEANRASAALPTGFSQWKITDLHGNGKHGLFVDGGMLANNPALEVFNNVVKFYQAKNPRLKSHEIQQHIRLISIGTGLYDEHMAPHPERWLDGLLHWGKELTPMIVRDSTKQVHNYMQTLLGESYIRLNPLLKEDFKLNNATPEKMKKMQEAAWAYLEMGETKQAITQAKKLLLE